MNILANSIFKLEKRRISRLSQLRELNLNENELRDIRYDMFINSQNLVKLSLSRNKLQQVNPSEK